MRKLEECSMLFEEIGENVELASEVSGAGFWQTVVCTLAEGLVGCVVSACMGNDGYLCTATVECQQTCN